MVWFSTRQAYRWVKHALLAGALATLAFSAHAESWDDVVAAAKKEGRVVFYNNLQPNGVEQLLIEFRKAIPASRPNKSGLAARR